jgi:hypothetical protein
MYQRVISLKIQVGNTNQRNKWANTDPRIHRRWDQVPRRSKHPLLIDHTRREPSSMILNAELGSIAMYITFSPICFFNIHDMESSSEIILEYILSKYYH